MREAVTRRRMVQLSGAAAAAAIAGCSSGSADTADAGDSSGDGTTTGDREGGAESFGGWFDGVSNFDGVVDRTGESKVTVEVGAEGNNGNYAFGPAAVRVDAGTTVVWKWVTGTHNVVADDSAFESDMSGDAGHTFERTFEDTGTTKYYCTPHRAMGMKGAVVVE